MQMQCITHPSMETCGYVGEGVYLDGEHELFIELSYEHVRGGGGGVYLDGELELFVELRYEHVGGGVFTLTGNLSCS